MLSSVSLRWRGWTGELAKRSRSSSADIVCLETTPIFTSDEHEHVRTGKRAPRVQLDGIFPLSQAIVTSMPALVPSAGVTMDERIANLVEGRGHELLLNDGGRSEPRGQAAGGDGKAAHRRRCDSRCYRAHRGAESQTDGSHGFIFWSATCKRFIPDFPVAGGVRNWEDYLPPLNPGLEQLIEQHGLQSQAMGRINTRRFSFCIFLSKGIARYFHGAILA